MLHTLIIFLVSIFATLLSSMSGGGASVVMVPVMRWLGISFPMAMSTQKLSSIFWVLPASRNYLKDRVVNWKFLALFSTIGLIGVYLGVIIVLRLNQRTMEIFIGILILILVLYTLLDKKMGLEVEKTYSKFSKTLSYIFAPILGFYESLFGSGNGIMFAIVGLKTRGFDFINALGYYYSVAFPWEVFATILYIYKGYYSPAIMAPAVFGSLIGGYAGSRYAKYKGNKFIKLMFVIVGTVLGLKLIFGFR